MEYQVAIERANAAPYLAASFLASQSKAGEYSFVPVVTERLFLSCSLDILFLRPTESGMLWQGGDIDNRIKTVFDALRIPTVAELPSEPPTPDEQPLYCLLEDDKLISDIRVSTDELLLLPHTNVRNPNDVFLAIHVTVKPTVAMTAYGTGSNIDFR